MDQRRAATDVGGSAQNDGMTAAVHQPTCALVVTGGSLKGDRYECTCGRSCGARMYSGLRCALASHHNGDHADRYGLKNPSWVGANG